MTLVLLLKRDKQVCLLLNDNLFSVLMDFNTTGTD